jgi:hypothetical protein
VFLIAQLSSYVTPLHSKWSCPKYMSLSSSISYIQLIPLAFRRKHTRYTYDVLGIFAKAQAELSCFELQNLRKQLARERLSESHVCHLSLLLENGTEVYNIAFHIICYEENTRLFISPHRVYVARPYSKQLAY